jgi:hypothetical protein
MINTMAKIDDLKATSRTSAFYFKGKDTSLMGIGEMLGVENVLQGSVRKAVLDARLEKARLGEDKFEDWKTVIACRACSVMPSMISRTNPPPLRE